MNARPYWLQKLQDAWRRRPIVWLSGVRRSGKTTLAHMLPDAVYLNCDLPSVGRRLADPETFFESLAPDAHVILDEVHHLEDPSRVLKIAADAYPKLRVLATGSSTLAATRKFRDSLTGRKESVFLPPVLWPECPEFGVRDLDRRLLHGGLPEPLLAATKNPAFFAEWLESLYARDIQELFGLRNRSGFLKLLQLLLRQSGGRVDYSHLATLSGMSRPTVMAHVEAMTIAHVLYLLRPYHGGGRQEITRQPKAYLFDTGFVTYAQGWESIHEEDRGLLWEHLVLDVLRVGSGDQQLYYWRDKSEHEIDFIRTGAGGSVDALECKINPDRVKPEAFEAFREYYPKGRNIVISPATRAPYQQRVGRLHFHFEPLGALLHTGG
jgi:hypothetical protein